MKIQLNKDASQERFNDVVNPIIQQAKRTADGGQDKFYYPIIRNETFNSFEVSDKVEDLTEGTVYRGRFYDGDIVFGIRTQPVWWTPTGALNND